MIFFSSTELSNDIDPAAHYFNQHDGLFGFILYEGGNGFSEGVLLMSKYRSPFNLSVTAYPAAYAGVVTQEAAPEAYDFCTMGDFQCE